MVNPVARTNWCLPRHTSTKTPDSQTTLACLTTRPYSQPLGPVTQGGGGGWRRGGRWWWGGRPCGHDSAQAPHVQGEVRGEVAGNKQCIDRRATPHCATKLWRDRNLATKDLGACCHSPRPWRQPIADTRSVVSLKVGGPTRGPTAHLLSALYKRHQAHGRRRKPMLRSPPHSHSRCGLKTTDSVGPLVEGRTGPKQTARPYPTLPTAKPMLGAPASGALATS